MKIKALLAGVALLDHGKPVSSMGTDFRDYDNDGKPDIVTVALNGETFPLFRNTGGGSFADAPIAMPNAARANGIFFMRSSPRARRPPAAGCAARESCRP